MYEVAVNRTIPKQTLDLTQLIEVNPIEVSSNVNDLVNIMRTTIEKYNATSLFVVYFIGKTMNDALLSGKYPGLTVTKLAEALGMTQTMASRYHRVAMLLTPQEVYDLRHIPYRCILKFPWIEETFGPERLKEMKFRLITNDFEGVKSGEDKFNIVLKDMSAAVLGLSASLPSEEVPAEPKQIEANVSDAVVTEVTNPCELVEDNGEDEDEGMLAIDKILSDRGKAAKEELSDEGSKSKSEGKRKAEIAFAQVKRATQKVINPMRKVTEELPSVAEAMWQVEDFIIGDPDTDQKYRESTGNMADELVRMIEAGLATLHELHKHGFAIRKVEVPEGTTAESILDPAN